MNISEVQSLFEIMSRPTDMELKFFNIKKYILATGGGLYWIIMYWIVFSLFAYELIAVQDKVDYMLLGLIFFCIFGLILTIGVVRHLRIIRMMFSTLDDQLKRHASDYNLIVDYFNRTLPVISNILKDKPESATILAECEILKRKFDEFNKTYFNINRKES